MKFIFPQNYCFKNKLFGFIDYPTAFLNLFWFVFIFIIVNLLNLSLTLKIFILVIFCLPLFLISIFGFNGENVVYIFSYILNFLLKQKLYFYKNSGLF